MKKSGFLYGAMILAIVNFIVRALGFSYKIILSKIIGPEGIGLFQMVFPVLMVFITFTTAGIPIAVSKLVAKRNSVNDSYGVKKVFRVAILLTIFMALILSTCVLGFGKYISEEMLRNKDVYPSIILLAPAIFVISIASVMRGYFYGLKKINPAGIAQILEQITRISFVLITLSYFYPVKSGLGAFIAVCGITVGEVFGLLWLIINYRIINRKKSHGNSKGITTGKILSQMSHITVPITLSRIISVVLQMFTAIIIPQRLIVSGLSQSEAVATFGRVTGMTFPIIFLPFIVTSALVINIIPNLSEQTELKQYGLIKRNISHCIRITMFISIPLTLFFVFFSNTIGIFFYNDPIVGSYIGIIGFATIFLSLQHTLSGILHGLGKEIVTTINYVIGMTIQLLITYFLVSKPAFGINGFFIGFLSGTTIICIFHFIAVNRFISIRIRFNDYILKPIIASLIAILTSGLVNSYMIGGSFKNYITFISTFACGGIVYLLVLFVIKGIPPNLIKRLVSK